MLSAKSPVSSESEATMSDWSRRLSSSSSERETLDSELPEIDSDSLGLDRLPKPSQNPVRTQASLSPPSSFALTPGIFTPLDWKHLVFSPGYDIASSQTSSAFIPASTGLTSENPALTQKGAALTEENLALAQQDLVITEESQASATGSLALTELENQYAASLPSTQQPASLDPNDDSVIILSQSDDTGVKSVHQVSHSAAPTASSSIESSSDVTATKVIQTKRLADRNKKIVKKAVKKEKTQNDSVSDVGVVSHCETLPETPRDVVLSSDVESNDELCRKLSAIDETGKPIHTLVRRSPRFHASTVAGPSTPSIKPLAAEQNKRFTKMVRGVKNGRTENDGKYAKASKTTMNVGQKYRFEARESNAKQTEKQQGGSAAAVKLSNTLKNDISDEKGSVDKSSASKTCMDEKIDDARRRHDKVRSMDEKNDQVSGRRAEERSKDEKNDETHGGHAEERNTNVKIIDESHRRHADIGNMDEKNDQACEKDVAKRNRLVEWSGLSEGTEKLAEHADKSKEQREGSDDAYSKEREGCGGKNKEICERRDVKIGELEIHESSCRSSVKIAKQVKNNENPSASIAEKNSKQSDTDSDYIPRPKLRPRDPNVDSNFRISTSDIKRRKKTHTVIEQSDSRFATQDKKERNATSEVMKAQASEESYSDSKNQIFGWRGSSEQKGIRQAIAKLALARKAKESQVLVKPVQIEEPQAGDLARTKSLSRRVNCSSSKVMDATSEAAKESDDKVFSKSNDDNESVDELGRVMDKPLHGSASKQKKTDDDSVEEENMSLRRARKKRKDPGQSNESDDEVCSKPNDGKDGVDELGCVTVKPFDWSAQTQKKADDDGVEGIKTSPRRARQKRKDPGHASENANEKVPVSQKKRANSMSKIAEEMHDSGAIGSGKKRRLRRSCESFLTLEAAEKESACLVETGGNLVTTEPTRAELKILGLTFPSSTEKRELPSAFLEASAKKLNLGNSGWVGSGNGTKGSGSERGKRIGDENAGHEESSLTWKRKSSAGKESNSRVGKSQQRTGHANDTLVASCSWLPKRLLQKNLVRKQRKLRSSGKTSSTDDTSSSLFGSPAVKHTKLDPLIPPAITHAKIDEYEFVDSNNFPLAPKMLAPGELSPLSICPSRGYIPPPPVRRLKPPCREIDVKTSAHVSSKSGECRTLDIKKRAGAKRANNPDTLKAVSRGVEAAGKHSATGARKALEGKNRQKNAAVGKYSKIELKSSEKGSSGESAIENKKKEKKKRNTAEVPSGRDYTDSGIFSGSATTPGSALLTSDPALTTPGSALTTSNPTPASALAAFDVTPALRAPASLPVKKFYATSTPCVVPPGARVGLWSVLGPEGRLGGDKKASKGVDQGDANETPCNKLLDLSGEMGENSILGLNLSPVHFSTPNDFELGREEGVVRCERRVKRVEASPSKGVRKEGRGSKGERAGGGKRETEGGSSLDNSPVCLQRNSGKCGLSSGVISNVDGAEVTKGGETAARKMKGNKAMAIVKEAGEKVGENKVPAKKAAAAGKVGPIAYIGESSSDDGLTVSRKGTKNGKKSGKRPPQCRQVKQVAKGLESTQKGGIKSNQKEGNANRKKTGNDLSDSGLDEENNEVPTPGRKDYGKRRRKKKGRMEEVEEEGSVGDLFTDVENKKKTNAGGKKNEEEVLKEKPPRKARSARGGGKIERVRPKEFERDDALMKEIDEIDKNYELRIETVSKKKKPDEEKEATSKEKLDP